MASAPAENTTRGGIDAAVLVASVRRALPILVIAAALAGAIAFLFLDRVPMYYRAETKLAVGVGTTNPAVLRQTLDGEVQLIRSRDIAGEVVAALSLGERLEYQNAAEGGAPLRDILVTLGLVRDLRALSPEERVLAIYDDNLVVEAASRSPVIRVGFWSTDPVLAAEAASAVAGAYAALRQSVADESVALDARIADLQAAIAADERRAAELRTDLAAMPALDEAARTALVDERRTALGDAERARSDADAIRAAIGEGTAPLAVAAFSEDPAIVALRDEQAALRAELGREIVARPLGNPRIAEIGTRLGEIDAAMKAEAPRIADALAAEAERLAARIAGIDAQLADADAAAAAAREVEALAESIAADRAALDAALRRQAALTQGGTLPNSVRVMSPAAVPQAPGWPDVVGLTALAFAATLLAGIVLLVLRDIVSGRAFRRTPFEPLADLDLPSPAAGRMRRAHDAEIARAPTREPTLALEIDAESTLGTVADSIAGRRRIVVTLAEESDAEGRPLAAVALARALANRDRTVVLVDLHADGADETALGEAPELIGFSDLLSGEASFAQAIFRDRRSRAHFIPAGSRPVEPTMLAGERLSTLLTALDHTYDHVVLDCPDDTIARIAPGADAALVASEYASTDPRTVRAVARVARASDAHVFYLLVEPTRRSPERAEAA